MRVVTIICLMLSGYVYADARPTVYQLANLFQLYASGNGIYVDVTRIEFKFIEPENSNHAGVCYPYEGIVEINPAYWNEAHSCEREALIFHELGHCILGRMHREGSIMAARLVKDYCERRAFYIWELFNGR